MDEGRPSKPSLPVTDIDPGGDGGDDGARRRMSWDDDNSSYCMSDEEDICLDLNHFEPEDDDFIERHFETPMTSDPLVTPKTKRRQPGSKQPSQRDKSARQNETGRPAKRRKPPSRTKKLLSFIRTIRR